MVKEINDFCSILREKTKELDMLRATLENIIGKKFNIEFEAIDSVNKESEFIVRFKPIKIPQLLCDNCNKEIGDTIFHANGYALNLCSKQCVLVMYGPEIRTEKNDKTKT